MENARDSSMWRSLAVAFGDGLAFGVGMKLTQNVARQPGMPHSGAADSADRIDRIEQRIDRLDHTPIAALEAAPAPEPAGFARKVIETVVQAVDERLNEHAKQMDLRLAALETRIAEVRSQFIAEIVAVHNRVEGDMRGFAESEGQLREEIQRVADRASSFDVSAAEAVIETKLVPLRVEITEMRQRLAESDRSVLDLILAIGQMCRQAAARIADPVPLPSESAPPPSDTEPPLNGTGDSPGAAPDEPAVPTDPPFESSAPSFTQMKKATSLWRVPAVSSFLLATGGLLLLHYL
jgi:hypothetical protein